MKNRDMPHASDTSKRLKKWGLEEFGSLVSFALALGISQQSLHDYTSGRWDAMSSG
ncbi:MAG: hypothetical protein NTU47_11340 [Ignavibacteriales bacterium]|nr:hypothetical protein [Ignavibacteriales bacterium]